MNQQPSYKLRKLTVGVCSVALMALFAGQSVVAHADDATTQPGGGSSSH